MHLLISNMGSTAEYAIIDFDNQTWFCLKDNTHSWVSFESLCSTIPTGTFIADRIVCDSSPYMDEFTSIEDYIAEVNADPACLDCDICCHFNSLSDLKSFIELTI